MYTSFVYIMSMMCTLSKRQTNRKVRTATQCFRSLCRTEESMLWRCCRSLVKEWLSLGHMTWKRLENKENELKFQFHTNKALISNEGGTKIHREGKFWPVCKCSGVGVNSFTCSHHTVAATKRLFFLTNFSYKLKRAVSYNAKRFIPSVECCATIRL